MLFKFVGCIPGGKGRSVEDRLFVVVEVGDNNKDVLLFLSNLEIAHSYIPSPLKPLIHLQIPSTSHLAFKWHIAEFLPHSTLAVVVVS